MLLKVKASNCVKQSTIRSKKDGLQIRYHLTNSDLELDLTAISKYGDHLLNQWSIGCDDRQSSRSAKTSGLAAFGKDQTRNQTRHQEEHTKQGIRPTFQCG